MTVSSQRPRAQLRFEEEFIKSEQDADAALATGPQTLVNRMGQSFFVPTPIWKRYAVRLGAVPHEDEPDEWLGCVR